MSKNHNVFLSSDAAIEHYGLDLKNRGLAALLAWLVPGLGHFYQGRNVKGTLFMLCIGTLLVFGIYVGQGRGDTVAQVVHASTADFAPGGGRMGGVLQAAGAHWKFVCQSGVGAVALPALVQRDRARKGRPALLGGLFAPPDMEGKHTSLDSSGHEVEHPNELAKWNYDAGFAFEVGTMYTVIAGLLNLIVIYDAAYGPLASAQVADPDPDDSNPKDSDS
ncbi:TM2 domain protein [Posidoniimonas polymericola]|uniref:TM2 domain protein n=1 Tax=Posidoniimonas polymericola TaxID=2528002 RepID=A0A5C5YTV9_9BACT|nr:DUF6677 family protein [Posidoniimonas polymericola]TWT78241.1 TM2 domain protein [Posidoniimonas polymericola]